MAASHCGTALEQARILAPDLMARDDAQAIPLSPLRRGMR
jgi:hypothetical protein